MTHTAAELKKALAIREKIDALEIEFKEVLNGKPTFALQPNFSIPSTGKKKRKMSPEGRAAIVAAQKARWAKKKAK